MTITEFCKRYYKYERYEGRGKEYAAAVLASNTEDFDKYGYCLISSHDSVTGRAVKFNGKEVL